MFSRSRSSSSGALPCPTACPPPAPARPPGSSSRAFDSRFSAATKSAFFRSLTTPARLSWLAVRSACAACHFRLRRRDLLVLGEVPFRLVEVIRRLAGPVRQAASAAPAPGPHVGHGVLGLGGGIGRLGGQGRRLGHLQPGGGGIPLGLQQGVVQPEAAAAPVLTAWPSSTSTCRPCRPVRARR